MRQRLAASLVEVKNRLDEHPFDEDPSGVQDLKPPRC